jgi:hypothetical protein
LEECRGRTRDNAKKQLTSFPWRYLSTESEQLTSRSFVLDVDHDEILMFRTADLLFICVNTPTKTFGMGNGKAADLKVS